MITDDVLLQASDTLKEYRSWIIFTHQKADGDAVGSATALYQMAKNSNRSISWYSPDTALPESFSFLPCFRRHHTLGSYHFADNNTLFVFLDCANETRSVEGCTQGLNILNIDHHEDNTLYGRVNCVDGEASSTCEMLYRVFRAVDWEITPSIARSLYTGIFTDTGSFTFSNTSPLTHRILAELIELGAEPDKLADQINQNKTTAGMKVYAKALSRIKVFGENNIFALSWLYSRDYTETGASVTETGGLPGMLMTLMGVKMIAMLTENFSGDIRVSFRSRSGSPITAGETARILGGGGHERAAGCILTGTLRECVTRVEELMMQRCHECSSVAQ